jgi:CheY-like chemotaxis protein
MAKQAKSVLQRDTLAVVADRGYYNGDEIRACEQAGIDAYLPKPKTSPNKAMGLFDRSAFTYIDEDDEYECPAGKRLTHRTTTTEKGKEIKRYWTSACSGCAIKTQCTTGNERRVSRWVHADVLDRAQARLDKQPDSMRVRRATVEHPFGTIKSWMGATHFQTKTLPRVSTEMSLHVLSYNMKRAINLLGTEKIIATIRA